jgi:hypothetical protein
VVGRNPAPVNRGFIPIFMGFIPIFMGLQSSKVMQDFFHPLYHERFTSMMK